MRELVAPETIAADRRVETRMRLTLCLPQLQRSSWMIFWLLASTQSESISDATSSLAVEMEPRISPFQTDYSVIDGDLIFEEGSSFTLNCQAIKAIKWKRPTLLEKFGGHFLATDRLLEKFVSIDNGAVVNPSDGYLHFSKLTVRNASFLHTGYYTCHHEETDGSDEDASDRVYVFVSGNNYEHWMAIPGAFGEVVHISFKEKKNLVVPCRPTHPSINITLLNGKDVIPEEGNWSFDAHKGFTMLSLPRQRSMNYTCQVYSWQYQTLRGYALIRILSLTINVPAFISLRPLNQTDTDVNEGDSFVWQVHVDAFPITEIAWYDADGSKIHNSDAKRLLQFDRRSGLASLKLRQVERFQTGQYRIQVSAEDQQKSLIFSLRVKYLPKVRIPFEVGFEKYVAQGYNTGEGFSFEWAVDSYPPPEIIIYFGECATFQFKNDDFQCNTTWMLAESIDSDTKHMRSTGNNETVRVTPKRFWFGDGQSVNVSGEANIAGEYLCRACNELGCSSQSFNTRRLQIFEVANGFDLFGLNDDAFDQDTVTLSCGVSFHRYRNGIDWTWTTPEGATININRDRLPPGSQIQISGNYKTSYVEALHWESIPINAAGSYTCRAKSLQNTSEEKSLEFKVLDAQAPVMIGNETEANVTWWSHGSLVELYCYFEGGPIPIIHWTKNDQLAFNASITTTTRLSVLTISSVQSEDAGTYRCMASNRLGSAQMDFVLGVGLSPGIVATITICTIVFLIFITVVLVKIIRRMQKRKEFAGENQLDIFRAGNPDSLDADLQVVYQSHLLPYVKRFEFNNKHLSLDNELSQGAFGVVLKGEAEGIRATEPVTEVTVKLWQSKTELEPLKDLISELKILIHLGSHLNVLNLLGACTTRITEGELMVIYEYCCHGNVRDFLIRQRSRFINQVNWAGKYNPTNKKTDATQSRDSNEDGGSASSDAEVHLPSNYPISDEDTTEPIRTQDLLCWVFQITRGMKYLASRKVVHGDLAARNILLTNDNVVKIADFGLARELYRSTDIMKQGNVGTKSEELPVRWMAIETIQSGIFSIQSDVWSFGIVMWELFTLGGIPYPGIKFDESFIRRLQNGYRMEKPRYAPSNIYNLMGSCWRLEANKRPSFGDLEEFLSHPLEPSVRQHYIDLNTPFIQANTTLMSQTTDYFNMIADANYVQSADKRTASVV